MIYLHSCWPAPVNQPEPPDHRCGRRMFLLNKNSMALFPRILREPEQPEILNNNNNDNNSPARLCVQSIEQPLRGESNYFKAYFNFPFFPPSLRWESGFFRFLAFLGRLNYPQLSKNAGFKWGASSPFESCVTVTVIVGTFLSSSLSCVSWFRYTSVVLVDWFGAAPWFTLPMWTRKQWGWSCHWLLFRWLATIHTLLVSKISIYSFYFLN